ncbi:MAG: Asp-tRNA(Asn)/Glu-tRNA(Gln) amidotransferase subunit GatC [Oscillospiraceae bacterium]|jgi:aspartyl-tRNA(Asn)/glutamyl-tRNA(Gln) amidotransferase subunit C|nr:Asp-tRNA(Asn)/Glu-tRNA(Gln) amidotransferase subunit GatC [Oscillospiraceae bacterium]
MQIDANLVHYLESLARISLSESERAGCQADLQRIIAYFDQLDTLDTAGVIPLSHAFPVKNVLRDDAVGQSMPVGELLMNAPREQDGCIKVFRTVD